MNEYKMIPVEMLQPGWRIKVYTVPKSMTYLVPVEGAREFFAAIEKINFDRGYTIKTSAGVLRYVPKGTKILARKIGGIRNESDLMLGRPRSETVKGVSIE